MKRFVCIALLLLLVFAGCSVPSGKEISSGEVLSPEEQASLYEDQSLQDGVLVKGTVYWSQSGTKYHKDPNCSHLKNVKQLQSGTIAQATNHGASSPCSRCAGGNT